MVALINHIDRAIAGWMQRHGLMLLRISLSVIFIWFGALKFYREAEINQIVARTVYWVDPDVFLPILASWEIAIGACLLFRLIRIALLLLFLQMPGTILPLFMLPEVCFTRVPWAPTMEGQYIIKNIVLISAAIVVGGTVRGRVIDSRNV